MKKIIFIFAILVFFASCKEDKLDTYSVETNVYFTSASKDSLYLNLKELAEDGFIFAKDTTVYIPLSIMGHLAGGDRNVTARSVEKNDVGNLDSLLRYYPLAKQGADFEILSSVIPANQETGYLRVKLNNSKNLEETGDTIVAAIILTENTDLKVNYSARHAENDKKNNLIYRIFFYSDLNEAPRLWNTTDDNGKLTDGIPARLGAYTPEKFALLLKACNLKAELFEFTDEEYKDINSIDPNAVEFQITRNGAKAVFESRFGPFDVFDGWKARTQIYLLLHPEEYDNFPNGEIVWKTSGGWGTMKKP
ncbi:MAG: hypothetical protein E6767_18045 [Dysgonomonas sp.]|nr:hypothetical protein [Dysgonomonas sp.]